jgi:predicted RNase H-like nuclease (RuvC/YqgF family)
MEQLKRTLERDGSKLARYTQEIEEAERVVEDLIRQRANLIVSIRQTTAEIEALENKKRVADLEKENTNLRRELAALRNKTLLD